MLMLLLLLPVLAAIGLVLVKDEKRAFPIALVATFALFATGLVLALDFRVDAANPFSHLSSTKWLDALGAKVILGIDGVSLVLILLTVLLAPVTCVAARSSIETRQKTFWFWFLILQTAMLGALMSLDLFLFFVFWELMLIPMYLMIGIWGGKNRIYAGLKFFLYTVIGSLPMLIAILYLAFRHKTQFGFLSFALEDVKKLTLDSSEQMWCFLAFGLSFAVKVPLWPFHTWLPDAHTEAPTPGSVILAGVLLKMGGYGFVRFAIPLFPNAANELAPVISTLAVIAIVAGSLVAMVQTDIKRLVAYSSVAHMGAVMLGLFSLTEEGTSGAIFQMLAHGISTGALFLLVGFLYERRHTREFSEFGGIAKVMPIYAICFVFVTLSSIALPGTNGFVGEFLILAGAFKANVVLASFAVLGAILGAWYMLAAVKKIFFGELTVTKNQDLKDLTTREVGILAPLLILILWMGVGAQSFLGSFKDEVARQVQIVRKSGEGN